VHGHAVTVEEAAEVEVEPDGADAGDAEAIADEGVSGGAAGDPVDPPLTALLEEIPDEEEVVGVADLTDDLKFLGELAQDAAMQGRLGAVTVAGAPENEVAEKAGRRRSVRRGEAGETEATQVKGKGALFGEAERFAERTGIAPATTEGLDGGGEGKVSPAFAGILLAGPGEGADRLDDLVGGVVAGLKITDLGKKKGSGGEGITSPRGATG